MSFGTLYVVATPLGNLEDVTFRALRVLREVSLIACEDTRRAVKLLNRYEIRTPMTSFHDHNKLKAGVGLLRRLRDGQSVALVSDAGTPGISDPGYELVRDAVKEEISVEVVPGPSALISALVVSGFPTDRFVFEGFLPNRQERRRKALAALSHETRTLVLYESPHRIAAFLADASEILGSRRCCVVRELTKVHEEIMRGTLPELLEKISEREKVLGEITVVVEGAFEAVAISVEEAVLEALHEAPESATSRDLAREISSKTGLSKKEVYAEILRIRNAVPAFKKPKRKEEPY
ncbi:MAG: 16S rRNA (cytidine(1402)-2'-O)-methyltransferase [Syntrophorhabdaceae bacterium]|nr:16S rRNA (cytidine(1402)-2'-O)-methyltransferase [Syntrophorhabdaceae bacterium]